MDWVPIENGLPTEDGRYLIYAPSMDKAKPLITIAWYNSVSGWSALPECWIKAITHWTKLTPPKET